MESFGETQGEWLKGAKEGNLVGGKIKLGIAQAVLVLSWNRADLFLELLQLCCVQLLSYFGLRKLTNAVA